jgi:hypothetical protein
MQCKKLCVLFSILVAAMLATISSTAAAQPSVATNGPCRLRMIPRCDGCSYSETARTAIMREGGTADITVYCPQKLAISAISFPGAVPVWDPPVPEKGRPWGGWYFNFVPDGVKGETKNYFIVIGGASYPVTISFLDRLVEGEEAVQLRRDVGATVVRVDRLETEVHHPVTGLPATRERLDRHIATGHSGTFGAFRLGIGPAYVPRIGTGSGSNWGLVLNGGHGFGDLKSVHFELGGMVAWWAGTVPVRPIQDVYYATQVIGQQVFTFAILPSLVIPAGRAEFVLGGGLGGQLLFTPETEVGQASDRTQWAYHQKLQGALTLNLFAGLRLFPSKAYMLAIGFTPVIQLTPTIPWVGGEKGARQVFLPLSITVLGAGL